jgi:hypothetical protein
VVVKSKASRTKPTTFRTVVVRPRNGQWTKRITDFLPVLPNAELIHILAFDSPLAKGELSNGELSHIRALLEASKRVGHLGPFFSRIRCHPSPKYLSHVGQRSPHRSAIVETPTTSRFIFLTYTPRANPSKTPININTLPTISYYYGPFQDRVNYY